MTPAQEVRAAADALWDRIPDLDADLFSVEEQPRSWSVALGQLAWEMERAGEDAPMLLRWRQALDIARSVNATTGDASAASSTNDKGEADITRTSPLL